MIKRISTVMLLCGAMLTASVLCGQENEPAERVPVGTRPLTEMEHAAQQESRIKLPTAELNDQLGQEVKVAAGEEAGAEASERVVQHSMFYTSHPGAFHRPYQIGIYGESIEFDDGSVWTVSPRDSYITLNWLLSDLLVVTPNHSWISSYNYRITNQNTGTSVCVDLTLGPIYNAPYTHWIIGIDYYNNIVYLEDGTVWYMSLYDSCKIKNWIINDTVIIGINDSWLTTKPNILINVNMLNHASGVAK